MKPHNPNNAFHWEGAPSIFTTGRRTHEYTDVNVRKNLDTSLRAKPSTIALPGGSPFRAPDFIKKTR